jgi:hypothetical protein
MQWHLSLGDNWFLPPFFLFNYCLSSHVWKLLVVLPSPAYLFTAGVEGFCDFIWSHSSTHHSQ